MYCYTVQEWILWEVWNATLGQVATEDATENYSLGESIWCFFLMIKLWLKICQSMTPYTLQFITQNIKFMFEYFILEYYFS